MNEEIKEIFKKLNNKAEHYVLYDYEVKILLDYITNLQEENQRLIELCDKYEEEHSTKFNEWVFDKRENERLAKDVDFWRTKYNEEFDEALSLTVYKSRNEKAIEYIEQYTDKLKVIRIPKIDFNYNDLLNILGGDKE